MAEAIANANNDNNGNYNGCAAGSGTDTITLTGNVTITALAGYDITSSLTINGGGYTVTAYEEAFDINGPAATTADPIDVTINNLKMTNDYDARQSDDSAIHVDGKVDLIIRNSTFDSFRAIDGTIVLRYSGSSLLIENSVFSNNRQDGTGSPIYFGNSASGAVTIRNSRFSNNSSGDSSGAIAQYGASLVISGSTFSGNSSTDDGGAIYNGSTANNLTITDSVFTGNSAGSRGGAISVRQPASIRGSVFSNNTSDGRGGAIFLRGSVTLENSTFYNNSAGAQGGAIFVDDFLRTGSMTVRHATFVNNSASHATSPGNAIFADETETLNIYNSIITSSAAGDDCVNADNSTYNLIGDSSCSHSTNSNASPQLASRSGNVYPLRQGSPAIDGANTAQCNNLSEAVDQRGVARPYGDACDIGAYEWTPPPPPSSSGGGGSGGSGSGSKAQVDAIAPRIVTGEALMRASGIRVWAQYGLGSGIQFQRLEASGVGNPAVIGRGLLDAVDVWGYAEQDWEVCFPRSGSLVFLDAAQMPRAPEPVAAYRDEEGYTCAENDRAGTLVLAPGPPAPVKTAPASVRAASEQAAAPSPGWFLSGCMVTTQQMLRFRDAPGGAPLTYTDPWGRQEHGWLPSTVTLTALERTDRWFKVDY